MPMLLKTTSDILKHKRQSDTNLLFASFRVRGRPINGRERTTEIRLECFIRSRKRQRYLDFFVELSKPFQNKTLCKDVPVIIILVECSLGWLSYYLLTYLLIKRYGIENLKQRFILLSKIKIYIIKYMCNLPKRTKEWIKHATPESSSKQCHQHIVYLLKVLSISIERDI